MVLSLSRYHQATRNLKRKQTTRQPCRHRLCRWEARHPSQMDGFHKIQANDAQKLIHGYNGMLCHVCRHAIWCNVVFATNVVYRLITQGISSFCLAKTIANKQLTISVEHATKNSVV